MDKVPRLSVFFPAYNEEKNIEKTVNAAVQVLKKVASQWEILVVDDGSTDKTSKIVKKLSSQNKRIKLIQHGQNKGYGASIKTGLYNARFPLICYTDSDGQFEFKEITKFIAKIKRADLVIGFRQKRIDSLFRRFLAKVLRLVNLLLFGLNIKDVDCGFKLLKKKVVTDIKLVTESAFTESELVIRAKKKGYKVIQIGVKHYSRDKGEQTGGKLSVILKAALQGLQLWWQLQNKRTILFFLALIPPAVFLRFYRLRELMNYLGDEGRDMLILRDIVHFKNFPLIGPPTSVGELYLGPFYYYLVAPFAWIFGMDPVGPTVFVALLGIVTIPLIFFVSKKYFNRTVAYFAGLLYAISPLTIQFSRSSWNPNPMPFFCLLLLLALYYWHKNKKAKFLYLFIVTFAIILQLHYMPIILTPFLLFVIFKLGKNLSNKKPLWYALAIILLLLSPLVLFDLTHKFVNFKGFFEIVKGRSGEGFSVYDVLSRSRDRLRQLFGLFLGIGERDWKNNLIIILVLLVNFFSFKKQKKITKLAIYGWAIWGILALGFWRHSVYAHYMGFMFMVPALLIAVVLSHIFKQGPGGKLLSLSLLLILSFFMLRATKKYLSRQPNLNINVIERAVRLVEEQSSGKPFNFALLTKNNYDASYRYFFKLWNIPAVYQKEVTDQLFVICEGEEVCQPHGNPKWEIAVFDVAYEGRIEKSAEWQPEAYLKIFKFIPQSQ